MAFHQQMSVSSSSTLSCHDLCYKVNVPEGCCGRNSKEKQILHNINAVFKPGMNAIMGPTGSGKSSLLDTLAGRKDPSGLSGQLLVDGQLQPKNYKCMTGYVVQDDVVMGTLTIRENFMFSANLRLSSDISSKEKESRVDQILGELGLSHVADSKVGNEFIRGVSGGERKRTNIGMELIILPSVLFLDEPTTGLDASTAHAVMLLLHQLARRGRTIIFSIHQPRYSIFRLCDRQTLLGRGYMIYHGPSDDALDFFSSIGYECEEHNNPPDFFLDVINGDSSVAGGKTRRTGSVEASNGLQNNGLKALNGSVKPINEDASAIEMEGLDQQGLSEKLTELYHASHYNADVMAEVNPILKSYESSQNGLEVDRLKVDYTTSFLTQLKYVSGRTIKNLIRNPQTSIMQTFTMIIFGLIVGTIYFDLDTSLQFGIQNRVGCFFFVVMNQVFSNLSAVELFIKERAIFIHENVSGFYRVSAYFVAKVFCDVLPMRIVPTFVFAVISYFMIGLQTDAAKFFIFLATLICVGLSGSSIAFAVSASVRIFAIANLLIALSFVFMMVFSGLLINLSSIAGWLRWIEYLSIFRYGMNALSINELKDMVFCDTLNVNGTSIEICNPDAGNEYLKTQGIPYETAWDLWFNHTMLLVITFVCMGLTYVQLRRINKLK